MTQQDKIDHIYKRYLHREYTNNFMTVRISKITQHPTNEMQVELERNFLTQLDDLIYYYNFINKITSRIRREINYVYGLPDYMIRFYYP